MRLGAFLLAATCVLAACESAAPPTFAEPDAPPAREISHWNTLGTTGFHFLPWETPTWGDHHAFDPNVQPTVRICRVTNGVCGSTLATFTRASGSYGQRVTVNTTDEEYSVNWPTGSTGASAGQVYRVSVEANGRTLGFMDVLMVTSWVQFFTTDTDEFYPWAAGWTFEIRFRIEQELPASVTISPAAINVGVGDGVAVSATVRGLSNQLLSVADMGWLLQNGSTNAAELDSGLVIGNAVGTGSLWAWAGDLMVQVPVTVTDTRRAWTAMATPADGQGSRGIWGTSATNIYAANNTGVLRWNGTAWTYADPVRWRATHAVYGFGASDV
ncbi:MAG TPA: hypothetical protein VFQ39_07195, partial [Longimicrobium sp.]|nr:hypothetical protein [Longimicrobium sp.]